MLTRSRDIRFGTVKLLPSRTALQLGSSLMKIVKLYAMRGFVVREDQVQVCHRWSEEGYDQGGRAEGGIESEGRQLER